jgi:hypothetical protein
MMVIDGEVVSHRVPPPRKEKMAQGNRRIRLVPSNFGRPIADALLIFGKEIGN